MVLATLTARVAESDQGALPNASLTAASGHSGKKDADLGHCLPGIV